jgi:hypothetical protein
MSFSFGSPASTAEARAKDPLADKFWGAKWGATHGEPGRTAANAYEQSTP